MAALPGAGHGAGDEHGPRARRHDARPLPGRAGPRVRDPAGSHWLVRRPLAREGRRAAGRGQDRRDQRQDGRRLERVPDGDRSRGQPQHDVEGRARRRGFRKAGHSRRAKQVRAR